MRYLIATLISLAVATPSLAYDTLVKVVDFECLVDPAGPGSTWEISITAIPRNYTTLDDWLNFYNADEDDGDYSFDGVTPDFQNPQEGVTYTRAGTGAMEIENSDFDGNHFSCYIKDCEESHTSHGWQDHVNLLLLYDCSKPSGYNSISGVANAAWKYDLVGNSDTDEIAIRPAFKVHDANNGDDRDVRIKVTLEDSFGAVHSNNLHISMGTVPDACCKNYLKWIRFVDDNNAAHPKYDVNFNSGKDFDSVTKAVIEVQHKPSASSTWTTGYTWNVVTFW